MFLSSAVTVVHTTINLPLEYHSCFLPLNSAFPFALVSHFPPSSRAISLKVIWNTLSSASRLQWFIEGRIKITARPIWLCHPICLHLTPYLIPPTASIPMLETFHSSWHSGSGGSLSQKPLPHSLLQLLLCNPTVMPSLAPNTKYIYPHLKEPLFAL